MTCWRARFVGENMKNSWKLASSLKDLVKDAEDDLKIRVIVSHPLVNGESSEEYIERVSLYYFGVPKDDFEIKPTYSQVYALLSVPRIKNLIAEDYTNRISWDPSSDDREDTQSQ